MKTIFHLHVRRESLLFILNSRFISTYSRENNILPDFKVLDNRANKNI